VRVWNGREDAENVCGCIAEEGGKETKKEKRREDAENVCGCIAEEGKKETKNEKRREDAENVCVYRRRAKKLKKRKE
jgi:hypothetical protein